MKKNFDESVIDDETGFKKRFRRIDRPAFLGDPKRTRSPKARITMYIDADILEHFKAEAEHLNTGYQTLINMALRERIDGVPNTDAANEVIEQLLKDRSVLSRLKAELEQV